MASDPDIEEFDAALKIWQARQPGGLLSLKRGTARQPVTPLLSENQAGAIFSSSCIAAMIGAREDASWRGEDPKRMMDFRISPTNDCAGSSGVPPPPYSSAPVHPVGRLSLRPPDDPRKHALVFQRIIQTDGAQGPIVDLFDPAFGRLVYAVNIDSLRRTCKVGLIDVLQTAHQITKRYLIAVAQTRRWRWARSDQDHKSAK